AEYRYDPFGNLISSSGTLASANLYRFSSKEIHVNSGMYYYLYRFYDPNLQRWINRDPIAERGSLNLYRFVRNWPINMIDSFGLQDPGGGTCWGPPPPPVEPEGEGPVDDEGIDDFSIPANFSRLADWTVWALDKTIK